MPSAAAAADSGAGSSASAAAEAATMHPLDVGAIVRSLRAPSGSTAEFSTVEVIERRETKNGTWQYYVHHAGFDRRLDEWVDEAQLEAQPEPAPEVRPPAMRGAHGHLPHARGAPNPGAERRATRNMKRKADEINHVHGETYDAALEKEHEESTKVKNIKVIEMGRFEVDAWYFSPYPDAFAEQERLYICPYSLKYFKKRAAYVRHLADPKLVRHPPGACVYRMPAPPLSAACRQAELPQPKHLTLYEIDGSTAKVYCQCLCLVAKLFLDHKTLYFDVDPFLFYALCEEGEDGSSTLAGYFSKEKASAENNNIACILVLPQHQRKGYGKLLIDLAYHITIREGKLGSPEKPLSDLGQLSFRSYWTEVLLEALRSHKGNLSIRDIATRTAIQTEDIIATLQSLNLVRFWKGQHVIAVNPKIVDEHLKTNARASLRCDPALLMWQPPPPEAQ